MFALGPVSVSKLPLPSRSHSYWTIVPSESLDPEPLKFTVWPTPAELGAVSTAVGAEFSATVTGWVAMSWSTEPSTSVVSVTRIATVRLPGVR